MSTKHTPGPWEIGDLDHAGQRMIRQQHIEICTCWHHGLGSIEREMEANARLIAAAPELLDALRNLVAVQPNLMANSAEIADARAAIAKTVQS